MQNRKALIQDFVSKNKHITGKRTLARLLHEEYPDIFGSIELARSSIRHYSGAHGTRQRNQVSVPLIIKEEEVDYDETWHKPFIIREKSLGVIGDLHGQFMDISAVNTAVAILKESGLKNLLINGDLVDNYYLSKFAKKAGRQKVIDELNFCKSFLERIRPMFDNIYFKFGNHDMYVDRFFANYPGVEGLVTIDERLGLTSLQIKQVHDLQEIKIGDLSIFHGHEKPGGFTPELVAKSFITWYQKYSGKLDVKVMFNHHHITDNYIMRNIDGTFAYGYGVGCLCKRLSYAPYPRWNTGLAEVRVNNGIAQVNNFEI